MSAPARSPETHQPGRGLFAAATILLAGITAGSLHGGSRLSALLTGLVVAAGAALGWIAWSMWRQARRMEARLDVAHERLSRLEALAAAGLAADGVVHELKNGLTVTQGFTELALRQARTLAPDSRLGSYLQEIDQQSRRLVAQLHSFLSLSATRPPDLRRPLGDVLREVASLAAPLAHARGLAFQADLDDPSNRCVHDPGLRSALLNLVLNALDHARTSVTLRVDEAPEFLDVVVEDDGPGVPPELSAHLFEPFASAREGGIGLGLWIVREAATREGGDVVYEPAESGGARFRVRLPARSADVEAHASAC